MSSTICECKKKTRPISILREGCVSYKYYVTGTDEERGLIAWADQMKISCEPNEDTEAQRETQDAPYSTYDFPIGMEFLRK